MSDNPSLVAHLASRHVASITVDVVSNDSFINDPARLTRETLAKVDANRGGIILFHDIKAATAKALPDILNALAERGYSVVHLVPKLALAPKADLVANFEPQVSRLVADKNKSKQALVPFFGVTGPERTPGASGLLRTPEPVTPERLTARERVREDTDIDEQPAAATDVRAPDKTPAATKAKSKRTGRQAGVNGDRWSTSVRRTFAD